MSLARDYVTSSVSIMEYETECSISRWGLALQSELGDASKEPKQRPKM